jgi:hypothetical protein
MRSLRLLIRLFRLHMINIKSNLYLPYQFPDKRSPIFIPFITFFLLYHGPIPDSTSMLFISRLGEATTISASIRYL